MLMLMFNERLGLFLELFQNIVLEKKALCILLLLMLYLLLKMGKHRLLPI